MGKLSLQTLQGLEGRESKKEKKNDPEEEEIVSSTKSELDCFAVSEKQAVKS